VDDGESPRSALACGRTGGYTRRRALLAAV